MENIIKKKLSQFLDDDLTLTRRGGKAIYILQMYNCALRSAWVTYYKA